jgi:hypothetical protein
MVTKFRSWDYDLITKFKLKDCDQAMDKLTKKSWPLRSQLKSSHYFLMIQILFQLFLFCVLMARFRLLHCNKGVDRLCRNPSFGLATKAKGLQGCGPKGSLGVTSGTPGSVGKCEGVNPHTPKATPALGHGVPVDSRNFRDRFEGSNLNGLWRSLYQWKALEA